MNYLFSKAMALLLKASNNSLIILNHTFAFLHNIFTTNTTGEYTKPSGCFAY